MSDIPPLVDVLTGNQPAGLGTPPGNPAEAPPTAVEPPVVVPPVGPPPPLGDPAAILPPEPGVTATTRPVEFAFTPAQAVRDLYDFNTTKDAKLYKSATDPLATLHNGTIETLRTMLEKLTKRIDDYNWTPLIMIKDDHGKLCNLILQNRALTIENVSASADSYIGKFTRASQDNYMMVTCILASLDDEGSKALRNSQYSYIKNGQACAALLIKVLLLDCEVETASTNFFVRAQLGNLEQHMVSIDYNIVEFNKHVSELLRKLRQGGEETNDDVLFIYMHVMRAYLICPDSDFLLVIKLQKIKAESDPKLLTLPILMIAAQKAYQTLLQEGTYNAPQQSHETRLMALAAKYTANKGNKGDQIKTKNTRNHRDRGPKPAWMSIAPTGDESHTKLVDGRHYHYCPHHGKWGQHKEVDCYVRQRTPHLSNNTTPPSHATPATTTSSASVVSEASSRLTMSAALATIMDGNDEDYSAFPTVLLASATTANHQHTSTMTAFDSDSFTILVDNGASRCMTNDSTHFIGTPTSVDKKVKGLGSGVVTLEGTVRWSWEDDSGQIHTVDIPNTLYCSDLPYCLLSPQHLASEHQDNVPKPNGTWLATFADHMVLYWNQQQHKRTIRFSSNNAFVGIMRSAPGFRKSRKFMTNVATLLPISPLCFHARLYCAYSAPSTSPDDTPHDFHVDNPPNNDETYHWLLPSTNTRNAPLRFDFNPDRAGEPPSSDTTQESTLPPDLSFEDMLNSSSNITTSATEQQLKNTQDLLTLHHRLGHMPFPSIRNLLSLNANYRRLLHCQLPVCSACLFAKATKRAWRTRAAAHSLPQATAPGQVVSVDQLESSTPGLVAQNKGKSTRARFTCATIFVDHFSRYTFIHMQTSTNAAETLAAKHAFESHAATFAVKILHYHGDNGRFSENVFKHDCERQGQQLSFCGVNAHFQNGIAERRIRDLQDRARTMIVHAKHHWPDAITSNLWPYALRLANEGSRCIPLFENRNPVQLFTGHDFQISTHQHLHPFGCPIYVLRDGPASGKKGSKWGERARCGIYLGLSPVHASSVCLVLSLTTGLVSPQFHVRADEQFETVATVVGSTNHMPYKSQWQDIHGFSRREDKDFNTHAILRTKLPARPARSFAPPARTIASNRTHDINGLPPDPNQRYVRPVIRTQYPPLATDVILPADYTAPDSDSEDDGDAHDDFTPSVPQVPNTGHADIPVPLVHPAPPDIPPPAHLPVVTPAPTPAPAPRPINTRPRRTTRPPRRLIASTAVPPTIFGEDPSSFLRDMGEHLLQESLTDPIAFSASSDPDTMYLHEARRQPDWPQFQQAMREEVHAHESRKHWRLVQRAALPAHTTVLPSVWSMKRKRRIATREIYKWKARLTAHGGKQTHGVNYWDTYAPVVNWTSIRLYLIFALLNNYHTRQIDFVLAYPQADVECDIYMEIPQGFEHTGHDKTHVLQLLKNIYGTKQAGRVWNKHIHAGLMERGYRQSTIDHCVYYNGSTIFLLYVDDGIFVGPDKAEISKLIASLKKDKRYSISYDITDEGTLSDYLGVKIEHLEGGKMSLSQPHLIEQILNDLGFQENTKGKKTPAISTKLLHRDTEGNDFQEEWSYRSVIGKLNFLEKSTRPDLSFAVHQCARFSTCPKESHAEAVRRIGRYLIDTRDRGIILQPTNDSFDCYVDADFCGTWNPDIAEGDASTSKSRTGFIIKYAGCPIIWQSKLQTETALSTTEAEYIALSASLREVISLMELLKEAKAIGIPNVATVPAIHCKVFEDNSGALTMAQVPKMRPRTKHLNVKYHHFRDHVERGEISLHPIGTEEQEADIFTKPLALSLFLRFRRWLLGW